MKKVIFLLFLVSTMLNIKAEGYQVNVQGQKNTAMGHTGTGLMLGSSAVHFNPGALGFMQKDYDFSVGGTLVFAQASYSSLNSTYQTETENPTGTPFYFYGAKKLNEKLVLALGVTTPYGNSLAWDENWTGRYLIQDISLKAIVTQPTLSYKINDKLGFGLGAMLVYGAVELNKALPASSETIQGAVQIKGSTIAAGFNAGIFYQFSEDLSVGIDYRSKVAMKMEDGDANFTVPSALSAYFPAENKFDSELPLPANLTFGLGYKVGDRLALAADLQYVFWSAYDQLTFDFKINTAQLQDSYNPREYKNTMIYRVGAEYKVSDKIVLRGGVYYDETPIQDDLLNPETPGMNKLGLSVGGSYLFSEKLSLDVSYLYIHGFEREATYTPANFAGTYNSRAIIPGIGLSYSF